MNEFLVRALIDVMVFLEFSDESEVDLDLAVKTLEAISAQLEGLAESEKAAFMQISRGYAPEFTSEEIQVFVNSLDQMMGW